MTPSRALRLLTVFVVLASTAGCDQATKHLARTGLGQAGATTVAGGLVELALAENPGAFLSLGATAPALARDGFLTFGVGLGLTCLLVYLLKAAKLRWPSLIGFALIWAGGMSNLIDRFARHGRVTDFITLRLGPVHTGVFNLADLAIVGGMLLLLITSLQTGSGTAVSNVPGQTR
jgi:signal peptidase II